jgi:hypothetical protein
MEIIYTVKSVRLFGGSTVRLFENPEILDSCRTVELPNARTVERVH